MSWHFFEFMDHPRIPRIFRETLLDVLDFCNTTYRPYYGDVAQRVIETVRERGICQIVELGAGRAPVTRELAGDSRAPTLKLVPCDLNPDIPAWQQLAGTSSRVEPVYEPVDFTEPYSWPKGTALLLVAALHHIPSHDRAAVLNTLVRSAECVLIFEPVRKTPFSIFLTLFAWLPALLTPVFTFRHAGVMRRILLCWLLPIVPGMFTWDAVISCVRQWGIADWRRLAHGSRNAFRITHHTHAHSEWLCVSLNSVLNHHSTDEKDAKSESCSCTPFCR